MTDSTLTSSGFAVPRRFLESLRPHLDGIPLGVITTDLAGIVDGWNAYAEVIYGYTAEEALGRAIQELTVGPPDAETAEVIMDRLGKGEAWFGTFEAARKDGSLIPVNLVDAPILDDDGSIVGVVGIGREAVQYVDTVLDQVTELRELADHLDQVRAIEQQRIAAQLHDHLSQPIAMTATTLLGLAARSDLDSDLRERLESLGRTMQDSLSILQSICGSLHPASVTQFGLSAVIEELAENTARTNGMSVSCAIDPAVDDLPEHILETIRKVVTECLSNIERHSGASGFSIEMTVDGDLATIVVSDDGRGGAVREGFGFRLMRERAQRIGGRISTDSASASGMVVTLVVPSA